MFVLDQQQTNPLVIQSVLVQVLHTFKTYHLSLGLLMYLALRVLSTWDSPGVLHHPHPHEGLITLVEVCNIIVIYELNQSDSDIVGFEYRFTRFYNVSIESKTCFLIYSVSLQINFTYSSNSNFRFRFNLNQVCQIQ